ncbi:DUF2341 domain-containing protein [Candidatus Daviesbacteria bacterium]|nr:DUF2341 domain-containing protein [Candidatus Daviesbacteria bacterium]
MGSARSANGSPLETQEARSEAKWTPRAAGKASGDARPRWSQAGFIKLTERALVTYLIVFLTLSGSGLLYLFGPWAKSAQAVWFDDNWAYRQRIPIDTHTASETNVYNPISVDTASLTTDKLQADCDDLRFTKENGEILPYQIVSGCDSATTVINVGFDTMPVAPFNIYMYYGNPSATIGSTTLAHTACGNGCAEGTFASEEKAPSPILYYQFDDAQGTTAQDSTSNNLDGTVSDSTNWRTEDMCVAGKCLYFDGTNNDNVSKSDDAKLDFVAADNFTIQAWVKRNGASSANNFIITKAQTGYTGYKLYQDASGDYCFDVSDGTNTDSACTSAVEFDDDKWHLVQGVKSGTTSITLYVDGRQRAQDASIAATGTLANTGTFYVGVDLDGTSNEWLGFIDEVKVYPQARTVSQIQADYNARANNEGAGVRFGSDPNANLADGLVGYWKMDESSGNASDSSGNGTTLTNNGVTTYASGKFGNAGSFNGTTQYLNTATAINSIQTVSFWVNTPDTTNYFVNLINSSAYITSSSGTFTATGFTTPSIYVNGVLNGTLTASSWNLVTITTGTGINANAFAAGLTNDGSNHFLTNTSKMDEVRLYNRALSPAEVSQLYNFAPGPVGYWKMEEKSGTSAFDSSGNSLTLAASNSPAWAPGKYGGSTSLNGSNQSFATSSNDTTMLFNRNFTIEAWIYLNTANQTTRILSHGNGNWSLGLNFNTVQFSDQNSSNPLNGNATMSTKTWHHVVVTVDSNSTSTITAYIDGVQDQQTTSTATFNDGAANKFCVGYDCATNFLNGKVDEIRIYNYPRTQAQIIEDMNAGHPAPGSPVGTPVSQWDFDEGALNTCSGGTNDFCDNSISRNDLAFSTTTGGFTDSGKFGKALNGTGAVWASRADDSDLDFAASDDASFSLWFKSDTSSNPSGGNEFILNKGPGASNGIGYAVYINTSDQVCFGIDDDTTSFPEDSVCSSKDVYDTSWHHIVATKTGTSRLDLYVDGLANGTPDTSISATGTLANSAAFYVGDSNGANGTDELNGDLDDLKVYRSALTADQVKLDMNRSASQVLGALSDNSTYQVQAANQEYCIPGDSTSCAGPFTHWRFDEYKLLAYSERTSGLVPIDSSGNHHTSTYFAPDGYFGPTWSTGKYGGGLSFLGSGAHEGLNRVDEINIDPASSVSKGASAYTIEGWVYPTGLPTSGNARPLYMETTTDSYGSARAFLTTGYNFSNCNAGSAAFSFHFRTGDSTSTRYDVCSQTALSTNRWYHVAAVFDSVSDIHKIYLNGTLDASLSQSVSAVEDTAPNGISIGAWANATTEFKGTYDDFRIYSYARTPAQIKWDMDRGAPMAYWDMDECNGASVNDLSGNSNTGTITIGASGTQTSAGACAVVDTATAWYNGRTGKINYSLNFDGTDDFVTTSAFSPLAAAAATTTKFSWGGWFYPTTSVASKTLLEKSSEFQLTTDSSSMPICGVYYSAAFHNSSAPTSTLTLSSWNHVLCTYDGTNINTYLNGQLIKQSSETNNVTAASSILYMGETSGGAGRYLGQMDEIKLFNYALSSTQVKTLYSNGAINYGPSTGAP